ncbi:MAG: TlpA disulfide reductase family protein [Humidesulfovibrio sp.]|nr:TlpA disulfide reductase family protein [Humidesulfovibrio sp.]
MKTHPKILLTALALCLSLGLLAACSGTGEKAVKKAGTLETLDMSAVEKHFAANKGKTTFVVFWATWCPACKTELPVLEQLRAKYPADKLDIMAVSVDDTAEAMSTFLKSRPTTLDVYLSKSDVSSEFGIKSIPALYILDKEGKVAFNSSGAYPFEMLDSVIEQLVKG